MIVEQIVNKINSNLQHMLVIDNCFGRGKKAEKGLGSVGFANLPWPTST